MNTIKSYEVVPADELVTLGVEDVMRTPADGKDRNSFIKWENARLAVSATFVDRGDGEEPSHQVVVENADGRDNQIGFSTEQHDDGTYSIATVSGWHREGRARLDTVQSEALSALIQKSIDAGPRRYR